MKRQVYIWHHYAANIVYAIVSILLLLDIDIGSKLALATEQDEHNVPTIVMHCILIGSILQMPVTKVNSPLYRVSIPRRKASDKEYRKASCSPGRSCCVAFSSASFASYGPT